MRWDVRTRSNAGSHEVYVPSQGKVTVSLPVVSNTFKYHFMTKCIEFNNVAISVLWHELPMLCRGQIIKRDRYTATIGNVKIALSEKIAFWLHPLVDVHCSLVVT